MENNMKMELDSNLDNLSVARVAITSFISTNKSIMIDDLMDIKTAVSEAVTNAMEHGYEGKSGVVKIECNMGGDQEDVVTISVADCGRGIEDVELATTPAYTSKPEMEHAGLGFTIMESFMDSIIIDSKIGSGTTIKMVKKLKSKKS